MRSVVGITNKSNSLNNFAITSAGIGDALQRSASALYAAGNTIDESIALVTAANSVIQNPEQVGTALKTLSLRLRGAKVELEEAGLDAENMAESTSTLQAKLKALTHGKVDIMVDADTFKSTIQILREMSSAWEEMTDIEQASALELMGGKRQSNILSSVITNFETVEEVIETSMNSSGSAIAENEKWMDSVAGKSEQLTNAMQALWNKTLNSDAIKFFLDLGIGAVKVVDKIGMIPSVLAGVLVYFTAFKKNNPVTLFKDMFVHMQNYQQALYKLNALNSMNLNLGTTGAFNTAAVNAYASAVAGLTAQKQAEALATSGLNNAQITEVMARNGVNDAVIRETLSKTNLANTTKVLHTTTVQEALATQLSTDAMEQKVVADFLAANGSKKLTAELLAQMVQQKILTSEQAANIASSYALAGANNVLGASFKTVGLAIKTAFISNPVGMILTIITSVISLTSWIGSLTKSTEELAQAADEAVSKYQETQKTLAGQKVTIDELSASYKKLSEGVDLNTNQNINLTTESYQEYLDVCNDIADMYPNLVTGFDAQGNAILSLKGNVDELIQAYKEAAQANRQATIAKSGDIFTAFKNIYSDDPTLSWEDTGLIQQIKLAEKLQELINNGTQEEINDFFYDLNSGNIQIDGQSYSNIEFDDLVEASGLDKSFYNNGMIRKENIDLDKFKSQSQKLLSFIKAKTTQINTETNKVKSLMDAYLGEDLDYTSLSDKSRAVIGQIVSGFDAEFIHSFDSADALYNYIKTNIVSAFQDPGVVDAVNNLSDLQLEFAEGSMSYAEYKQKLDEYVSSIQNKVDADTLNQIKVGVGVDEESLQVATNHISKLLGHIVIGPVAPEMQSVQEEIQTKINSLSVEDIKIGAELEVPEGTILSWDEFVAKIEEAKIAATQDFDITNYTDAISAHSAAISEYQEALQSLDKGSFTMDDFMDLIKKYPELAKGVDVSSNAFYGLSRNLNKAIKTSTKSFVKDLKELKVSLVATGKSTESIDQLIDAIENLPEDALDSVIQKYSTLTEKIDGARLAQDKLMSSMEENPNEGYETRGEAMDYMKEAMQKGEIGSESNLWNVAKQYGFTYDSAKTINENADALAKFIATRERWFKTEDDGDDRTNDGYSYEGTENFIKDVESALKSNEELQQYLTWDYDETTGTLNFDYDNKNWDKIVSILSTTKELAGLTSEEFSDMLVQVGQYFGIKWGDYDDVLDHLNGIATGTSDAKTKVEEYGQAMQDYFGENSDVDLTVRPMVKFDETNFKEWKDFYQKIIDNPDGHSEADVKNAKEQVASILRGDSYATVYSSTFSNEDGTKSIVVTPILPDGTVLSPEELEAYADKLLSGETIDPNIDIKLAEFDGSNSVEQANAYAQALHEVQAEYDTLRDTLGINTIIDEKGIAGLQEVEVLQSSIKEKSDGTTVIDEDAFREALIGAEYTEDQIDLLIDKIKNLDESAINIDPLNLDDALIEKGLDGLQKIEKIKDSLKKDSDTGLVVFDTDMFTAVLKEAGYADSKIEELIGTIKEYDNLISVSGNTDPLGLNSASLSADGLKASLSALDIAFKSNKNTLIIEVPYLVDTLHSKGWTDDNIKTYVNQLANDTDIEGLHIQVNGIENIDEVIETANKVPEEKKTEYEVTGTGLPTLDNIENRWDTITKDKTTNYTINEHTVKTTTETSPSSGPYLGMTDYYYDPITKTYKKRYAKGTAFAEGNWGAPKTETALVGELGPELLVRGNRWTTVGDNGAEFTQVKKGDIIFNHRQTEELLKNGHVTSRGKAYASGTAYSTANGTFARYEFSGTGGWKQYDVNDKVVETWGDLSGAISDAGDAASDAADEFAETLDWIEIRLEEINEDLDLMNAQLENAGTYASKNNIIDQMIGVNNTKMKNLIAGIKEYSDYAAKLLADVPAQYREAAQDGAIDITEFTGEANEATVEAIEKYREWAQKVADLTQQLEETKTEIRDLAIQKYTNIYDAGEVRTDIEDSQTEKLQNAVDLIEESGNIADSAYYTAMMENSGKKIEYWTKTRDQMQKAFDDMVRSGQLVRGSDKWYEELAKLYEVDAAIDEATIELEEYQNAINDIYWDNFDELINRLDYIEEETQSLIDLMDNADMVITPETEDGWRADQVEWTEEGIASLGLYAQQMETAEYKSKQYAKAIEDLTKDYKAGKYSESEYLEKLNELKDGQYEAIESYYDAQDAIVDLNKTRVDAIKEGIEKEIEAYEELINKKKEELNAEKDLHDFQKSTMEQQKNIADIQRRLAALAGDNSASAVAKRKQLEAELAEANAELEESYYDRSVENQQNALDKELEDFQAEKDAELEKWDKYLEDVELIITESLGIVQDNASGVYDTLSGKASEYNLTLSDAILTPWKDGALAVSDYQSTFDTAMSSTTNQLNALKSGWQEVINLMARAGINNVGTINKENAKYAAAEPPKQKQTSSQLQHIGQGQAATGASTSTSANTGTPSVGGTVTVKSTATHFGSKSKNAKMASFVPGGTYTVYEVSGDQILIGKNGSYTGWVKKSDLQGYASGTLGVDEDQLAFLDELGEELVMHAGPNGKLSFLSKGSSVIPHDITENLMKLGQLDPSEVLDRNRPSIGVSPEVHNTEINLNITYGDIVSIGEYNGNNLDELQKMVKKEFEQHTKDLNSALRKYVR